MPKKEDKEIDAGATHQVTTGVTVKSYASERVYEIKIDSDGTMLLENSYSNCRHEVEAGDIKAYIEALQTVHAAGVSDASYG